MHIFSSASISPEVCVSSHAVVLKVSQVSEEQSYSNRLYLFFAFCVSCGDITDARINNLAHVCGDDSGC